MSKTRALYHIVFATKRRQATLSHDSIERLYRYIWGICQRNNCYLHRIGGIYNHVHILLDLPSRLSLADLMRQIKSDSSNWIRHNAELFPYFEGWAKEYYAGTISLQELESVKNYISNQMEHHLGMDFKEELTSIGRMYGLNINEFDLME